MAKNYIFTSESVTEGHPDKVSDHISDAILDEFLRHDPDSRVAVETLVTTDFVTVAGEVTSKGKFDIEKVVRDTIAEIGYDNPALKFDIIEARKPTSVALNGPDGLLPKVQDLTLKIGKKYGIPAYLLADTTWGTCDLNSNGAKVLNAEILFNIGHTNSMETFEKNVIMIDAFDDISFDRVVEKCTKLLLGKTISLITDSQHLNQIESIKNVLEENGVNVKIGKGSGQLNDGQVFGCEFYPATEMIDDVDANVFLGQSNFHAAGVALATNKPTYILDPYFNEIREITDFAKKLQKKATLEIYKSVDAETFGVIVGLKEGQISKLTALKFKKELESAGKTVHLIALTDITNERLRNLKDIDAFIQVACPRISTDNRFDKPVLSTPQAVALMKLLRKENIENYFQIKHWL
ncbi:diphthamide biosynthesis enzyme Dph2 [Marine Group I thaumarchaeote]|uniref:Diphthamide biosynthesis enzyme Dph2 n=1 Tax=Marine Group I thaumarchaeote TaxID=2511932 RepID=A0A7K4NU99_9ARCH|nr:diphthamide biosynthesis enzyme Dph2 [Marine Group I thaumarchaeote]